jgi:hypothetical protein
MTSMNVVRTAEMNNVLLRIVLLLFTGFMKCRRRERKVTV